MWKNKLLKQFLHLCSLILPFIFTHQLTHFLNLIPDITVLSLLYLAPYRHNTITVALIKHIWGINNIVIPINVPSFDLNFPVRRHIIPFRSVASCRDASRSETYRLSTSHGSAVEMASSSHLAINAKWAAVFCRRPREDSPAWATTWDYWEVLWP